MDRIERVILLQNLKGLLSFYKYDQLELEQLQPLKDEVEAELAKETKKK